MREPLILIPGLNQTSDLWRDTAAALSPLMAIMHADLKPTETIGEMAEEVLRFAPPRFGLAGLSMGGYVAMEVIRRAPERVSRVAFLNTTARADTPEQSQRRLEAIELAKSGRFETALSLQIPMLLHPDNRHNSVFGARIRAMARVIGPEGYAAQQRAIMGRVDSRPSLGAITCPALALVGDQDQTTPPALAQEIAEAISGANYVEIEGAGHLPPLEQPGKTAAALGHFFGAV